MFKNLRHLCLVYAAMLISFFTLLPASFATTSTSWQELGSAFPFTYTSATSNIQNSNVQLVVGFVNGVIEYYNPSTQTWINIPSPAPKGGTAVTALLCDWNNTINADGTINSNVPDVLAGYADGSVWYYQANQNGSGTWDSLGTPNSNEQVTKFGGVSISSSNNLTGCNAETAVVPEGAVTPTGYTNKQLWTYNGANWSMLLQNAAITCIDPDMNPGSGTAGLSSGDIQQNGDYDANVSSNQINAVAYLGQNNRQNEYFYGDTQGNYGIGFFNSVNTFASTTCLGVIGSNYTYTSVSPVANGNQSVIVADSAVQLLNITNNYSTVNSVYPACWQELPTGVSFNGLYVDWNGTEPNILVAGLTNGQLIAGRGEDSNNYQQFDAPPNFPSTGEGCSQTFTGFNSSNFNAVEIFNNGNNCYVYTTSNSYPVLTITTFGFNGPYYVDVVDPQILGSCTVFFTSNGVNVSGGLPPYSIVYTNLPQWASSLGFNGIENQSYLYVGEYGLNAPIMSAPIQGTTNITVTDALGNTVSKSLWINFYYDPQE